MRTTIRLNPLVSPSSCPSCTSQDTFPLGVQTFGSYELPDGKLVVDTTPRELRRCWRCNLNFPVVELPRLSDAEIDNALAEGARAVEAARRGGGYSLPTGTFFK